MSTRNENQIILSYFYQTRENLHFTPRQIWLVKVLERYGSISIDLSGWRRLAYLQDEVIMMSCKVKLNHIGDRICETLQFLKNLVLLCYCKLETCRRSNCKFGVVQCVIRPSEWSRICFLQASFCRKYFGMKL